MNDLFSDTDTDAGVAGSYKKPSYR